MMKMTIVDEVTEEEDAEDDVGMTLLILLHIIHLIRIYRMKAEIEVHQTDVQHMQRLSPWFSLKTLFWYSKLLWLQQVAQCLQAILFNIYHGGV